MIYGYIRVSSDKQTVENQRFEINKFCDKQKIEINGIGLAIQYVLQMTFGFRAMHDNLGAVINILVYTPCFSINACILTSEYGSARYVSTLQKR